MCLINRNAHVAFVHSMRPLRRVSPAGQSNTDNEMVRKEKTKELNKKVERKNIHLINGLRLDTLSDSIDAHRRERERACE